MATKNATLVGDFFVTSHCRRSGSRARKIPLGSNDVDHVLDFDNGSTLPYDVRATTILPDAPPHDASGTTLIEFSYGGGAHQTSWNADIAQIASGDTEKDAATIHCVTTTKATTRLQTTTIEYRLNSSSAWESDPACVLPLEIKMNVE